MKCSKCKKTLDDSFTFCPYCGKKVSTKIKPSFTNGEFLLFCRENDFEKEFNTMTALGASDAFLWLKAMHEGVNVYAIVIEYEYSYSYNMERKCKSYEDEVTADEAIYIATGKFLERLPKHFKLGKLENYSLSVKEKRLVKTMLKGLENKYFWEKEKAEATLRSVNNALEAKRLEDAEVAEKAEAEAKDKKESTRQNSKKQNSSPNDLILMPQSLLEKIAKHE